VYHLGRRFGKKAVFNDVFDIQAGERFREVITSRLEASKVFLAVIGNGWLNAVDEEGSRRLDDPADYVRFEIETALSQPHCLVIPVLVSHQPIPKKGTLPHGIAELVERNAVQVRPDPDFADDIEKLCQIIATHVPRKRRWPMAVAAAIVILVLVLAAFFSGKGRNAPDTIVHAVDSSTGERILRPFGVELENGTELPSAVEHLLVDTKPEDVRVNAVKCRGFKRHFQASSLEVIKSEGGFLLNIPLERITADDDFFNDFAAAVKPDLDYITGLPDDPTRKRELVDNKIPPGDVELIVENKTEQHVDVFLYWLPPSDELNDLLSKNPFATIWTPIGLVPPGDYVRYKSFRLERGYFLFFASTNGTEARKLYAAALYKAPFAVATITELTEQGLSLKFADTMPSEFSNP